ncbi:hypothetical protein D5R40_04005, partial [Okeania hirsuta]
WMSNRRRPQQKQEVNINLSHRCDALYQFYEAAVGCKLGKRKIIIDFIFPHRSAHSLSWSAFPWRGDLAGFRLLASIAPRGVAPLFPVSFDKNWMYS